MSNINNQIDERRDRLEKLKKIEKKINPFPTTAMRTHNNKEAALGFDDLAKKEEKVTLVGRIRSIREHGGSTFAHIEDGTGKIQIYIRKNEVGAENYQFFGDSFDVGDFIEATGTLFLTKKEEKTLMVSEYKMLSKALLPLPEKWHGLTDTEIRYRKRYLDLISNPQVKDIFIKRSLIIETIREFFLKRGFIEVDTPILQPIPGGATAKPFVTHHNALDTDLYLRVAPELYLKRLIVGGYEKVFEIARCFRNEGIDYSHNPEFSQVEFYQAYANYEDLMQLTEELIVTLVKKLHKGIKLEYEEHKITFKAPFSRLTFRQALIDYADIDLEDYPTQEGLMKITKTKGLKVDKSFGRGKLADELYKEFVRKKIINPTFIIDHPVELSPLSKKKEENPGYVERFQLVLGGGIELCNAFSELNDPIDQVARFHDQEKLKKAGDEEAQYFDENFVTALEHGMPPTAGEGIGIDRLVQVLTDSHNIREVILFPILKPNK